MATEIIPVNNSKEKPEQSIGDISVILKYDVKIPGIILENKDMRMKLHTLMEKAGRTSGSIQYSYEQGFVYISFPDYKESLVLNGTSFGGSPPDYIGKGKTFELNDNALLKVKQYLERKKIQSTIQTSLTNLTKNYERTA